MAGRVAVRADLVFAGEVLGTCWTQAAAAERGPRFGDAHGRQGWLSFPHLVKELPPTSRLVFTLYGEKEQGGAAAAARHYKHDHGAGQGRHRSANAANHVEGDLERGHTREQKRCQRDASP